MRPAEYELRMTEAHHGKLHEHLFPGDGLEAVALLLCGRREGSEKHVMTVREVAIVPHELCRRSRDRVTWPLDTAELLLRKHYGKRQAIVKVHSHAEMVPQFSATDDVSDKRTLASFASFLNDELPHGSAIMLPDFTMFGRVLLGSDEFKSFSKVAVVGDDLRFWPLRKRGVYAEFALRQAQAFGEATVDLLRSLTAGVVGCSGTGSIVVEQLARLGFKKLVLVDPDRVEEKNLNRMVNAAKEDAYLRRNKVDVLASAIARMGLGQEVVPIAHNLISRDVVLQLAECDIIFGCMDGVEGRHYLNRLCTFYCIPYFDVGVKLKADGRGGIANISGTAHYVQPGRSSLLSRGMYTMKQVEAEGLRRTNPELYEKQRREGYIRGVPEDRPAVISINALLSSIVVNDMLARLHPYRNLPNSQFAGISCNLAEMQLFCESERDTCEVLSRHVGRGDVDPLLERPALSS